MRRRLLASIGLLLMSGCYSVNGYVMNSSGQAFYDQGNYSLAAAEFEKAVASTPWNPDYQANLARTRFKMGDVAGAEQVYRQVLTQTPSHQPAYHGLAELMLTQDRTEEATAMLNTWTATQPYVAESHVEMAWLQNEIGNDQAAVQSLQQALQINPGHSKALAHMGQYYQEHGQPTQAMAMYQKSLQSDWSQPEVHSRVVQAAAAAGPNHPATQIAMARGGMPPGYAQASPSRMAGQPPMQMAWANGPAAGPYGFAQAAPGPWQTATARPMSGPPGQYAAAPYAAAPSGYYGAALAGAGMNLPQQPFANRSEPIPDPAFDQPATASRFPVDSRPPVSAISHDTLLAPPHNADSNTDLHLDDLPMIDAF